MSRRLLTAMLLAGLVSSAHAEGLWLEGVPDCGQWVAARTSNQSESFEAFAIGLLSGMSMGSWIEVWQAKGIKMSREQLYLYVDNYCRANPLKRLTEAMVALINERTDNAWDKLPK